MTSPDAVAAHALSKRFGGVTVLRKLSLTVQEGETALLLGPNGAGKSTLLRIVAGLLKADSGSIHRPGGRVGYTSHHLLLYPKLTVRENLELFSRVGGIVDSDSVLREWELESLADRPVSELSRGNQARVSMARAMLGEAMLLLLDEPSSNLDDHGTSLLLSAVDRCRAKSGGRTITLIATHDVHRLRGIASRVLVLERGAIAADSGSGASSDEIETVIESYRERNR